MLCQVDRGALTVLGLSVQCRVTEDCDPERGSAKRKTTWSAPEVTRKKNVATLSSAQSVVRQTSNQYVNINFQRFFLIT